MLTKIIWSICALLIISSIGYFADRYFVVKSRTQILGIENTNLLNIAPPDLKKLPSKTKDLTNANILTKSAYLIDANTLYPLYTKDSDEKLPVASLTKMATALVVLENHSQNLDDEVTITYKNIAVPGTDIQLKPGEKMTVKDLLKGLLIMSGNDTANALADHFGGKETFVKEMNKKVKEIGALDTEFKDPAGLDDEGFSTAHDLALIATYGLNNKTFAEIVKTTKASVSSTDGRIVHDLTNSNRMLQEEESNFYLPSVIGVKTGFTSPAGHVMVSAAVQNNQRIIAVVLNTNESSITASAKESKKLLEWGFANWTW